MKNKNDLIYQKDKVIEALEKEMQRLKDKSEKEIKQLKKANQAGSHLNNSLILQGEVESNYT
jgi:hypothetical protein